MQAALAKLIAKALSVARAIFSLISTIYHT